MSESYPNFSEQSAHRLGRVAKESIVTCPRRGLWQLADVTNRSDCSKSGLPFHEKAGRCQALLWLDKFISDVFLCPDIEQVKAGEAAVKAERERVHLEP